jgi:hypothetical protein
MEMGGDGRKTLLGREAEGRDRIYIGEKLKIIE